MGHATLNTIVENKFATVWGSTTSIKYENIAFTPGTTSWVAIKVRESDSDKITLGTAPQLRRTIGNIIVDIFTPLGQGSAPARVLVDSVKVVFRDFRLSGLHCYEGISRVTGEVYYTNSGSGEPATAQWYQATVIIPFKFDESL